MEKNKNAGKSGSRVASAFGAFGTYLDPRPVEPCPPDFSDRFFAAVHLGSVAASQNNIFDATHADLGAAREAKRLFRAQGFRPYKESGASVWDCVYAAGFWFSASETNTRLAERFRGKRNNNTAAFGARAQRDLTLALMSLSLDDRRVLQTMFDRREHLYGREWKNSYRGAISVARVATCLVNFGIRPIASLIHVDTIYTIDLLGELDAADPGYLCLQIKSSPEADSRSVRLNKRTRKSRNDLELDTYLRIRKFQDRYQVPCIPALIHVGHGSVAPWETTPSESLTVAIRELLQRIAR